jgi:hypothetical protein
MVRLKGDLLMADKIEFFGPVDKKPDGTIRSFMPIWAQEKLCEDVEEEVGMRRRALERGEVPDDAIPGAKQGLERAEEKWNSVRDSRPKLTGEQKDICAKSRKSIGEKLTGMLFTASQMATGVDVQPFKEVEMMTEPCVKVEAHEKEGYEACGIKIRKGKVTRQEAERVYILHSKSIGEDPSIEKLRRKDVHENRNYIMVNKDTEADEMMEGPTPRKRGGRKKKEEPEEKQYKVKL